MTGQPEMRLNMAQIQADLFMAHAAINEAKKMSQKAAKYLKGQAGYHLQQAAEKMVKIQMYRLANHIDNARMYKHSIDDLLFYASSLNLELVIPSYVYKQKTVISSWEAEGRYDIHFVVKMPQLEKTLRELTDWHQALKKDGYK